MSTAPLGPLLGTFPLMHMVPYMVVTALPMSANGSANAGPACQQHTPGDLDFRTNTPSKCMVPSWQVPGQQFYTPAVIDLHLSQYHLDWC